MPSARRRCPTCRSRKLRRDATSGLVLCDQGHVYTAYLQETNEADGPSQHSSQRRVKRKNKTKKGRQKAGQYHGARARFVQLQAAQHLLRLQTLTLIKRWNFPPEYEHIVRDLWAIYVSYTGLEVDRSQQDQQEAETDYDSQTINEDCRSGNDDTTDVDAEWSDALDRAGGGGEGEESDSADTGTDVEMDVPTSAQPQRQRSRSRDQERSSSPETFRRARSVSRNSRLSHFGSRRKTGKNEGRRANPSGSRDENMVKDRYNAVFNLVILYLACWRMRVPVFMQDLLGLAKDLELPYLLALNHLPQEMVRSLNAVMRTGLQPSRVLPVTWFQQSTRPNFYDWLIRFRTMYLLYDITFPPPNMTALLVRCCNEVNLTAASARVVERMLEVLYPDPEVAATLKKQKAATKRDLLNYPVDYVIAAATFLTCMVAPHRVELRYPAYLASQPISRSASTVSLEDESEIDAYLERLAQALPRIHLESTNQKSLQRFFPLRPSPGAPHMPERATQFDPPHAARRGRSHSEDGPVLPKSAELLPPEIEEPLDRLSRLVGARPHELLAAAWVIHGRLTAKDKK